MARIVEMTHVQDEGQYPDTDPRSWLSRLDPSSWLCQRDVESGINAGATEPGTQDFNLWVTLQGLTDARGPNIHSSREVAALMGFLAYCLNPSLKNMVAHGTSVITALDRFEMKQRGELHPSPPIMLSSALAYGWSENLSKGQMSSSTRAILDKWIYHAQVDLDIKWLIDSFDSKKSEQAIQLSLIEGLPRHFEGSHNDHESWESVKHSPHKKVYHRFQPKYPMGYTFHVISASLEPSQPRSQDVLLGLEEFTFPKSNHSPQRVIQVGIVPIPIKPGANLIEVKALCSWDGGETWHDTGKGDFTHLYPSDTRVDEDPHTLHSWQSAQPGLSYNSIGFDYHEYGWPGSGLQNDIQARYKRETIDALQASLVLGKIDKDKPGGYYRWFQDTIRGLRRLMFRYYPETPNHQLRSFYLNQDQVDYANTTVNHFLDQGLSLNQAQQMDMGGELASMSLWRPISSIDLILKTGIYRRLKGFKNLTPSQIDAIKDRVGELLSTDMQLNSSDLGVIEAAYVEKTTFPVYNPDKKSISWEKQLNGISAILLAIQSVTNQKHNVFQDQRCQMDQMLDLVEIV